MAKVTLEGNTDQIIDTIAKFCPVCRKQRRREAALKGWETRRKTMARAE